jgi:hypothetical protein
MASNSIGNLNVQLNLEIGRLQAQIDTANGKIRGLTRRMESDFSKAAKNVNKALASLGVGLSVGAITAFGKSVIDLGGKITDLSRVAGLGTDQFQDFVNVAAESDVDAQQVANSFVQMRKNIQDGAKGIGGAVDALSDLKLNAKDLQSLAPERQFEEIAKSIQSATDKNKAFNAGLEILGAKNAPRLTEVLQRLGTDGLDAFSKSVEKLRLSPEQLRTLDDAGDKLDRMWTRLKVLTAKAFVVTVNVVEAAGEKQSATPNTNLAGKFGGMGLLGVGYNAGVANQKKFNPLAGVEVPYNEAATKIVSDADKARAADWEAAAKAKAELNQKILDGNSIYIAEQEQLRAAAEATTRYNESQKKIADLRTEGAAVTASVLTPLESYNTEISRLVELQNAGVISAQTYDRATVAAGESYQKATEGAKQYSGELDELGTKATELDRALTGVWENVADRAAQSFADILIDGESTFNELPRIVARALAEIAVKMAIINPLINGLFGLSGASALPAFFGSGAAIPATAGGGFGEAGKPMWVGERGKEMFVPDEPGMIVPNHRLGELGGGSSSVINIDARGSQMGVIQEIRAGLSHLNATFNDRAIGAVANERRRGGGMGRGLGA